MTEFLRYLIIFQDFLLLQGDYWCPYINDTHTNILMGINDQFMNHPTNLTNTVMVDQNTVKLDPNLDIIESIHCGNRRPIVRRFHSTYINNFDFMDESVCSNQELYKVNRKLFNFRSYNNLLEMNKKSELHGKFLTELVKNNNNIKSIPTSYIKFFN